MMQVLCVFIIVIPKALQLIHRGRDSLYYQNGEIITLNKVA